MWAESAFGEGSTFFVSLPRLSQAEYDKRMIAVRNQEMLAAQAAPVARPAQPTQPVQPAPRPVLTAAPQAPKVIQTSPQQIDIKLNGGNQ